MNLYLCGMIGSGKTTIGTALAKQLGIRFLDLDQEMDARLGYSFHRLVAEQGWLPFRELEYTICKFFAQQTHAVVCLGGGTVRYEWNLDALRGSGMVVLLEAREEVLIERVSIADRPRVTDTDDPAQDVRTMWRRYRDRYVAAADYVYRSDEKTVAQEVADLAALVTGDSRFTGVLPA